MAPVDLAIGMGAQLVVRMLMGSKSCALPSWRSTPARHQPAVAGPIGKGAATGQWQGLGPKKMGIFSKIQFVFGGTPPHTLGLSVFDFICQPKVFDASVFANNPETTWLFVGCAKAKKYLLCVLPVAPPNVSADTCGCVCSFQENKNLTLGKQASQQPRCVVQWR